VLPLLARRFPRPSPFEPPPTRIYDVDQNGRRYLARIVMPVSPRSASFDG